MHLRIQRKIKRFFRKLFFQTSRYYSYSYYRDRSFYMYNNLESLCNLFKIEKQEIKTDKTIFLHAKIPFGSNSKLVKRKLGKPMCYIKKCINTLEFNILFYKMYLGGYKTKQEAHFFEDKLYYFSYVFSYMNDSDKESLKKLICKKYLKKECDLNNLKIVDKYGSAIFITESVDFTINYLCGDKNLFDKFKSILKEINSERHKLHKKNHEELLMKL